jgi:hypothetical protein
MAATDERRKVTTFEWACLAVPIIAGIAYLLADRFQLF